MNSINITPAEFLSAFFAPTDTVCLRALADKKPSAFSGQNLECKAYEITTFADTLQKHNAQNRGIFFVVNSGGQNDTEIIRVNAQFVESDSLSFEEQEAQLDAFPLPPSIIVKTAKSLHCYWLVRDADIAKFRTVQRRLVAQFSGDPQCVNKSRVMRLPGFNHCKGEPVMVECVKFSPELVYTQAQLEAILPQVPDELVTMKPPQNGSRKGLTLARQRCDFLQYCKDNAAVLPEGLWYAMISNLTVFDGGIAAIHALSKPYPGYDYNETNAKIAHFIDSSTKPMTCTKIVESGYNCAKINGICGCKSPAGLAYKPLTSAELLIVLNSFDKQSTALDNIQIVRGFIQDYLYNIDGITAETLINYEIKSRFDFKANDLKPLISLHRELYKRFCDSKEYKSEVSAHGDIPAWYEITDKGGLRFLPGVLAEHMAVNVRACYSAEQYYLYRDGVYNVSSDLSAKNAVRNFLLTKSVTMPNISDAEGQWRMLIEKPITELNSDPSVINVENGLYNVSTDELSPHTPEYYSSVQLNVSFTPDAVCPKFRQFLAESFFPSDIALVQEMLGYFLVPVTKAQKSFVIVGEPGAGKSQILLVINKLLLGQRNVSNVPWQSLNERFKTAELFGKLANIFADLPSKAIDDNGIFKAVVGEDFITAERKGKDPFTFQSYARLLFSCNSIPRNYGDKSEGFYRRLIIIRFAAHQLPEERKDPELMDKFCSEADGIFMFALEGLKRLIGNKYKFSETESTRAELHRYRVDSNSVLSFIDEHCTLEESAITERNTLFDFYRDYCKSGNMQPVSQKTFNKDFELAYPGIARGTDRVAKRRTWLGIRYGRDDL
ncbi:hypothetical protein FACS1894105_02500 [Clostridia bacterium]|nr:hypothetical protein FACS1894105_02500 [Clostridia bacterium]